MCRIYVICRLGLVMTSKTVAAVLKIKKKYWFIHLWAKFCLTFLKMVLILNYRLCTYIVIINTLHYFIYEYRSLCLCVCYWFSGNCGVQDDEKMWVTWGFVLIDWNQIFGASSVSQGWNLKWSCTSSLTAVSCETRHLFSATYTMTNRKWRSATALRSSLRQEKAISISDRQ